MNVIDTESGLTVDLGRSAIHVGVDPWHFVLAGGGTRAAFPLHNITAVAATVSRRARHHARPADRDRVPSGWELAPRLLAARERWLPSVNPGIVLVLDAIRAVGPHVPALALSPLFHDEPHLAADVVAHRPAAIVLSLVETLVKQPPGLRDLQKDLVGMRNWRGAYAPGGRVYPVLNRLLADAPADIAPLTLLQLRHARVGRRVAGPRAFVLLLQFLDVVDREHGVRVTRAQQAVLEDATDDDVARACAMVGRHQDRALDPDNAEDLREVALVVADAPLRPTGRLPAMVRRSFEYLRTLAAHVGTGEPVARPPVPLPTYPGVRFLGSADVILEEGARMRHCVDTFANAARNGRCFLFHVDHEGESATVEVSNAGRVRQAKGPRNVANKATRYGADVLSRWGERFARHATRGVVDGAEVPPAP